MRISQCSRNAMYDRTSFFALAIVILYRSGTNGLECEFFNATNSQNPSLLCYFVTDIPELTDQLNNILSENAGPFEEITFVGLGILPCMPSPEIFKNIQFNSLTLNRFTLESWYCPDYKGPRTAFTGLKSVGFYRMKGIENWNWKDVNEYTGNSVELFNLEADEFRFPSSLQKIYGNHVKSIGIYGIRKVEFEESSLHCPECETLDIFYSDITSFRKEIFGSGLTKLTQFYLRGNSSEKLPKDLFQNVNYEGGDSSSIHLILDEHFRNNLELEIFQPLKKTYKKIILSFDKTESGITTLTNCECDLGGLLQPGIGVTEVMCKGETEKEMELSVFLKRSECENGTSLTSKNNAVNTTKKGY